jgi:hypothetical protein
MDSRDEAGFNVADWQGKVLLDVNGPRREEPAATVRVATPPAPQ